MTAIDAYLDRLRHELQSSPEETEEVLREVRSHLELAALETGRGRGQEASSVAQAIDRFGGVQQIGGDLRQVHGRATLVEAGLAALPMLLFSVLLALPLPAPQSHYWIGALLLAATALAWRAALYIVLMLLVGRRDWLAATLATHPLPRYGPFATSCCCQPRCAM